MERGWSVENVAKFRQTVVAGMFHLLQSFKHQAVGGFVEMQCHSGAFEREQTAQRFFVGKRHHHS